MLKKSQFENPRWTADNDLLQIVVPMLSAAHLEFSDQDFYQNRKLLEIKYLKEIKISLHNFQDFLCGII